MWCTQYVYESWAIAAQAIAVHAANVTPVDTAARLRSVNHSRGTKRSTVGWKAAATPISTPPTRSPWAPRTAKQPSRTRRTGMMLVCPSQNALRTGSESISRLMATGAASSDVRRPTGWGRARAATRPRATTSSSEPKVHPQPRACSAARVKGLRTRPTNGVPVNCVES